MPGSEKRQVVEAAKAASVSHGTLIRTAVRFLAEGIRDETIKRLTKSRKISQDVLAKKWKEENVKEKAPGKLQELHKAHNKAYDKARDEGQQRDTERYEARGIWLDENPAFFGMMREGLVTTHNIDQIMQAQVQIEFDKKTKEEKIEFLTGWLNDEELAEELMKAEEEQELSDEEIEAAEEMLEEWMEALRNDMKEEDD